MSSAVEQMREVIENGIVVFTPPWLGDVLLEIVGRLEALEEALGALLLALADALETRTG